MNPYQGARTNKRNMTMIVAGVFVCLMVAPYDQHWILAVMGWLAVLGFYSNAENHRAAIQVQINEYNKVLSPMDPAPDQFQLCDVLLFKAEGRPHD